MKNHGTIFIVTGALLSTSLNSFVLVAVTSMFSTPAVLADSLQGEVKEKVIQTAPARLKRTGSDQKADTFSSGSSGVSGGNNDSYGGGTDTGNNAGHHTPDAFDTPEASSGTPKEFMVDPDRQETRGGKNRPRNGSTGRPPQRNTSINSATTGGGRPPLQPPPRSSNNVKLNSATPQMDPDETHEMKVLWDAWHKQVAATIYREFDRLASLQFRRGTQAGCKVKYEITSAGRVRNVHIVEPSHNQAFDSLVEESRQHNRPEIPSCIFPKIRDVNRLKGPAASALVRLKAKDLTTARATPNKSDTEYRAHTILQRCDFRLPSRETLT